jgi:hypothetical protein
MLQLFPARCVTSRSVSVQDSRKEYLSATVRIWTCHAGPRRNNMYSMNESQSYSYTSKCLTLCFLGNLVFFSYHHVDFFKNSLNWYRDKRKYRENFSTSFIGLCIESSILLPSILWKETRWLLHFSLFWIFCSSSSNKIDDKQFFSGQMQHAYKKSMSDDMQRPHIAFPAQYLCKLSYPASIVSCK